MCLQVFDKGFVEDGEGRFIDFKNTLILLNTHAGTDLIAGLCKDPDQMLGKIVTLQLNRIKKRVEARYKIPVEYGEDVVMLVVSHRTERESGGRMIDAILTNTLLPDISREFLTWLMEGQPIARVRVSATPDGFGYDFGAEAGALAAAQVS